MSNASNLQVSYLGGEIAPSFQGRADHPKYKTGLSKCFNSMPLETGAWARRPGSRVMAPTRGGVYGKLIDFDFSQSAPYTAEFTDGHLRFFASYLLVHTYDPETVTSISTANPAVVTVTGNTTFINGDMVEFFFPNDNITPEQGALLLGRQFLLASVSGGTFALFDGVTGAAIDGSTLNFTAGTPCIVQRVLDLATPYTRTTIPTLRGVQALNGNVNTLVLLQAKTPPQTITSTAPPQPVFALNPASFLDGPYMDPIADGTTITPSAASGTIQLTASNPKFVASDVGRSIRLLSQPANWVAGTTYGSGALVTYNNAYYTSLAAGNVGNIPGTDAINWGVATNASAWVWAVITIVNSATVVHATLQVINTPTLQLPGVLVNTNAMTVWRLGAYSYTTGFPTCGTYTEGRLFLSGVIGNRFDASVPNDIFNFSPTAVDGTVADNNAISYTFNSKDINAIFWMTPQQTGVLAGTQASEWLIQASSNGDVLTPTSCQAKRVTKYGSSNIEPVEAPFATLFVTRNQNKVFEYLADVFTGKFSGINVSLSGSHLAKSGVAEIRYQKELTPVMWARMNDGTLAGMTYRRESPMLSEQPAFSGWHSHALGTGRLVSSIAVGPSVCGNLDTLSMVTYDSIANIYYVELLTDLFSDTGVASDAWFVDGGVTPAGSLMTGFGANATNLEIFGLQSFNGKTISAYIAGVDVGDYPVSNGVINISLPAGANGVLTGSAIAAASNLNDFSPTAMPVTYATQNFPTQAQSVQAYIGPTTPVTGTQGDTVLVDFVNSRIFNFKDGNASTDGIRTFDIMSGIQTNQAPYAQIYPSLAGFIDTPYTLGDDDSIYTTTGSSNATTFLRIDPNMLTVLEKAGKVSGNLSPDPVSIRYPNSLAAISVGGGNVLGGCGCGCAGGSMANVTGTGSVKHFVLAPSLVGPTLNVVEMTPGIVQNAGFNVPTFSDSGLEAVAGTKGSGIGYLIGWGSPSGTGTDGYHIYKTTITPAASGYGLGNYPAQNNPGISNSLLATIAPASIDVTWTHVSNPKAILYDNSDGNLLVFANNAIDVVTNKNYLIKVNVSTGAVMWATAIEVPLVQQALAGTSSYIAYGIFAFMSTPGGATYHYNNVNTLTGAITQTTLIGVTANVGVWDSRLGVLFVSGGYTAGGGAPIPLNSTPNSFSNWFALRLTSGATIATGRQYYTIPAALGATFTSQGQRLRPLEPAETGARNGPALGKTRRNHRSAFIFLNTAGIAIGTTFANVRKAIFKTLGGTAIPIDTLYNGVHSTTIEDTPSYDGQVCWQVTRPHPATVLANEGFLETEDR